LDTYYILDTGSTDGTQDAIRKVLGADKGEIWEEPFLDYGRSRNRALEIAQQASNPPIFSLMLSADETVHNPQALRRFCEMYRNSEGAMHEAYPIQMDVGWKFDSVRLSRTEKGWRYVGRVHEYLAAPDRKWRPTMRVPDVFIRFRVTDPERRGNREYKIRDILLDEVREKPTDTRASFYLARTYNVLRNHSAALTEFQRRISLGGWQEEVYESYYAIAFQREALGEPWPNILQAFLDAHGHSPDRGEPLFNIAQHYYNVRQYR
jgi:glycosyltransferase involved in cell wall biosynthesis